MTQFLRYCFSATWLLAMLALFRISAENEIDVPRYARYITIGYTIGAMVWPENLTKIIQSLIDKYLKDEK